MNQEKSIPIRQRQPRKINIFSAKEFSKKIFPRAQWVIYNLFESGTMNMLSAAPNHYKSWLAFDIATSVATGAPLFGFFMVNSQQTVWIINEEDTENGIQERMNLINKKWPEMPIYFSIQNQIMLDDETIHQIIYSAKERKVEFIIFDSLRSIHLAEENSATKMQKVMNQIKKIINSGVTVLFTHHNRKKTMFKNSDGEDSRGSTAINAAVHSHLSCEPKKEDGQEYLKITQAKLKGAKKMDPFCLRINIGAEGDPFVYEGAYNGNTSHTKIVEKILELLKNGAGAGINLKGFISANMGVGDRTIREIFKEMVTMKSIIVKTWSEVQMEELSTISRGIAHNEKFFFLPLTIKEDS